MTGGPPPGADVGSNRSAGSDLRAHGIGGQQDLPIPLDLAISGAVAALVVSFTVLALAWRNPRYSVPNGLMGGTSGRPAPAALERVVAATWFRVALRVLGMVVFCFAGAAALFGKDSYINPFFGIVAVWLWVGLVPASLLFGPFYRAINPVRTINLLVAKVAGTDPGRGMYTYPARLGLWPAALGLYAFVWMELVEGFSSLGGVRLWFAVYVAVMLVGGVVFGETFYRRADPFEVYSSLVAKLSVWGVREGRLLVRSPLANLASVTARPGLLGVLGVLFGSTGYDSFSESSGFVTFVQGSDINGLVLRNGALLLFCLGAMGVFALGAVLTGVGPQQRRRDLPDAFAHALVPIVVGYVVAHYLTYFLEVGSRTLIQSGDPFSRGWNLLGLSNLTEITWFSYHPTLLASVKVLAVVAGHVTAAVAGHDRAIGLLPRRHQLTGQLPLLLAMVAFTWGGLYLLFSA